MASLTVGNLIFHFATIRTESYAATPLYDPSGRHFECTQIDLTIVGVVNAVSIASNKPNPGAIGSGSEGDRLPRTTWELQRYLMVPRRHVVYEVAGTAIIDLPQIGNNDVRLASDPKGGPIPRAAKFTQFVGDKSAILSYSVTCHDSRSTKYTLSHAWDVTASIDERGYSTRRVSGRAAFRKDFLAAAQLQPDFFRQALFPPCPRDMRRVDVQVSQDRSGDSVTYSVTDREVTFGLGDTSDVTEIRGSVTCTVDTAIKGTKDTVNVVTEIIEKVLQLDATAVAKIGINTAIPVGRALGVARVYGRKGANRNKMAILGKAFILDRLDPIIRGFKARAAQAVQLPLFIANGVTAASVTHNFDSDLPPFAEVRLDVFLPQPWVLNSMFRLGEVFNLLPTYADEAGQFVGADTFFAPELNSGNSRGTWLEQIVTQTLLTADQSDANVLPPAHPAAPAAVDFANLA